ncbi:MAG: hypothetical protein HYV63_12350 [Candidatus Schekmanbacteria bacterium]|nr:hypothetical protein [Candidatus Schekmanbacteria bacterium]
MLSMGLALLVGLPTSLGADRDTRAAAQAAVQRAMAALEAKRYEELRENLLTALSYRPDHPVLLAYLARAEALTGHAPESLHRLHRLLELGVDPDLDFAATGELGSVLLLPEFADFAARREALQRPILRSNARCRLSAPRFLPEGVAWNVATEMLYVSSVHERRIVAVDAQCAERRIAGPEQGLDAVLGMVFDAARNALWAVTTALPEMTGYREGDAHRSRLVMIPLGQTDAEPPRFYECAAVPPGSSVERPAPELNDVTLAPSGEVFVADSRGGAIYRLANPQGALQPLVPAGTFVSPGGLATDGGGKFLYVADYAGQLARVEIASGAVLPLTLPADLTLYGVDGLARHGAALIAVQNGIRPHRVLSLQLSDAGDRVIASEVLERAHPAYHEPTLGVVAGDTFTFVANSQWELFGATGAGGGAAEQETSPPLLLRLPLGESGPAAGLAERERAFSDRSEARGVRDAFLEFLDGDAMLFRPHPVNGREHTQQQPDPPIGLVWRPARVEVSASGDLGYSTGPFVVTKKGEASPAGAGRFFSIWRRDELGEWKVLVDAGADVTTASPADSLRTTCQLLSSRSPRGAAGADHRGDQAALDLAEARLQAVFTSAAGTVAERLADIVTTDGFALREGAGEIPLAGRADARALSYPPGTAFASLRSGISAAGDLAFSVAAYRLPGTAGDAAPDGYAVRVWRFRDRSWRLVADSSTPVPRQAP